MRNDHLKSLLVLKPLIVAAGVAAAMPLLGGYWNNAQAAERPGGRLEEIMVTARRVEESLQDAPVSVTAFSQDDIRQIGASEPQDIADYTPNLTIRTQTSTNDDYAISLRGVAEGEPALAIDPAVGLYVDEVYIARNAGMAFDIVDMERIEVLRGPQGTLFGRNTIGGAINIVTEKPRGEFAYRLQAGYGNYNRRREQLTVDTPRFGNWSAKLSVLNTRRQGDIRSLYGGTLGDQSGFAARGALRWDPTDAFILDYTYTYTDREGNGQTSQLTHVRPIFADPGGEFYGGRLYEQADAHANPRRLSRLPVLNSASDENTSTIHHQTLTLDWRVLENLQVRSISSFRDWDDAGIPEFASFPVQNEGDVLDGRRLETEGEVSTIPAGTMVPLFRSPRDREQKQWTQEFQFIGDLFGGRLRYNAGLFYFQEEGFEDNPQTFVLPTALIVDFAGQDAGLPQPAVDLLRDFAATEATASATLLFRPFQNAIENRAYAVYGDLTWQATTNLEITLGARYSIDERWTSIRNIFDGEVRVIEAEEEWSRFTPSITLDYNWSPEINTYFKIATGYRAGGFNVRAITESSFKEPFDPEEMTSFELGIKSEWLNRSLRFNAAVFHYIYEDRQIAQFEAGTGGASSKIENAGKSATTGLEIDSIWMPFGGARIVASYGFLDVDYKEYITGPLDPISGFPQATENVDIAGVADTRLYAPRHTASLALDYRFSPWAFGQLRLRGSANYTGEIAFHPQLTRFDSADSRTLFNARASLAEIPVGRGDLELSLWGRNLTDEGHRDFGIDFGILGFTVNEFGRPRSYGLELVYSFNR